VEGDTIVDEERDLRRAAEAGDSEAMDRLGVLLAQGHKDREAEGWFRRGAEAGDACAMVHLGWVLDRYGDSGEAELWYRRVADNTGADPVARAYAAHEIAGFAEKRGDVGETDAWLRQTAGIIAQADYAPTFPALLCSALIRLGKIAFDSGYAEYAEQL
jgi:TPR repeat protein